MNTTPQFETKKPLTGAEADAFVRAKHIGSGDFLPTSYPIGNIAVVLATLNQNPADDQSVLIQNAFK